MVPGLISSWLKTRTSLTSSLRSMCLSITNDHEQQMWTMRLSHWDQHLAHLVLIFLLWDKYKTIDRTFLSPQAPLPVLGTISLLTQSLHYTCLAISRGWIPPDCPFPSHPAFSHSPGLQVLLCVLTSTFSWGSSVVSDGQHKQLALNSFSPPY